MQWWQHREEPCTALHISEWDNKSPIPMSRASVCKHHLLTHATVSCMCDSRKDTAALHVPRERPETDRLGSSQKTQQYYWPTATSFRTFLVASEARCSLTLKATDRAIRTGTAFPTCMYWDTR